MKKSLSMLIIPFLGLSNIAIADEAKKVEQAFNGYKTAILAQEGMNASQLVTASTIAEYQKYIDWAKTAERKALESLSFFNRLQVFLVKHRIPRAELLAMDGRELFAYAVNNDWIGKTSVIPTTVGNVEVSSSRAISDVFSSGKKVPIQFLYRKENGTWKFDLYHLMINSDGPLRTAALQSGLGENEFIFKLAETLSGTKVTDAIWSPLLRPEQQ